MIKYASHLPVLFCLVIRLIIYATFLNNYLSNVDKVFNIRYNSINNTTKVI